MFYLGLFYWALLNIDNHQKYTLTALQLFACTLVTPLRNEKSTNIFSDIITNLNLLSGNGLEMVIAGKIKTFNGFLAFFLGDTPALNWLGGFKESCSKAFSFCRTCDIKHGELFFDEKKIVLRNLQTHNIRLDKMKHCGMSELTEMSKKFGINYHSPLMSINNFDICKCLLQDPMHIFWEGICHLELKCFLDVSILKKKLFSLNFLNEKIATFKYFTTDKTDIPNQISLANISAGMFTQTSGQMSTLFQNLPLMLGEKFSPLPGKEDKNWQNFLRLLNIINLCYCFIYNKRTILELKLEIKDYLTTFVELYPSTAPTPKMHFLIHLPNQMKEFGPLRLHATHRFEAKNGLCKCHKFKNFRNICKSVSYRQELWMVSKRYDYGWSIKDNFLSRGIVARDVVATNDEELCNHYRFSIDNTSINKCSSILINGFNYKPGIFVILKECLDSKLETLGLIRKLFLVNQDLIFELDLYDIVSLEKNFNCLKIKPSNKKAYRFQKNLIHKQEVNSFVLNDNEILVQIRFYFNLIT